MIEVQYHCPTCGVNFVVYHNNDRRNTNCAWCGKEVKQTGRIAKIEGADIVTYQNNQEINRRSHG